MTYEVTIDNFEGPLDLLLHLIKESNISIYEISIDTIAKQYFDYIKKMKELNLNIASEYLVMSCELMEMKSKALLPRTEDEEIEDDPKEELINRLVEYEKYKNITSTFKELEKIRKDIYTKEPANLYNYDENDNLDFGVNLNDLLNAFSKFIEQKQLEKPLNTKVTNKEYSITKRSNEIKNILKKKKKIKFIELFDIFTKEYVVVTFLSILAMTTKQEIEIEQEYNFKDIIIKEKGAV